MAEEYCAAICKLVETGAVKKIEIDPREALTSDESWYIPHHLVSHNGKSRLDCSFQFQGRSLNEILFPGSTLEYLCWEFYWASGNMQWQSVVTSETRLFSGSSGET